MNINSEEDNMSSLDAYVNLSSLLQISLFKYKLYNLWPEIIGVQLYLMGKKEDGWAV